MGKRYVQHSDLCGCERCAIQWERENPQPVFDEVDDPSVLDCGCDAWRGCDCYDYDCEEVEHQPAAKEDARYG